MKLDPFSFYDEAEAGDYVEIRHADGQARQLLIDGMMLRAGESLTVDVIASTGSRFALRAGDRAEIISRGGGRRGY